MPFERNTCLSPPDDGRSNGCESVDKLDAPRRAIDRDASTRKKYSGMGWRTIACSPDPILYAALTGTRNGISPVGLAKVETLGMAMATRASRSRVQRSTGSQTTS